MQKRLTSQKLKTLPVRNIFTMHDMFQVFLYYFNLFGGDHILITVSGASFYHRIVVTTVTYSDVDATMLAIQDV